MLRLPYILLSGLGLLLFFITINVYNIYIFGNCKGIFATEVKLISHRLKKVPLHSQFLLTWDKRDVYE